MRYKQLVLWLGLALGWIGYWAPWIAHRAAALNLNGYDLAEWISRLPGVRDGSLRLGRLDFLLPLAAISVLTALAANTVTNPWLRWPARLLALLGAFLLLPEYPFILTAHTDPELRPALILGVVTLLVVGALIAGSQVNLTGLLRKDLSGFNRAAYISLAVVAIFFTVRALLVVWPALAGLFNASPGLNWGPVVLVAGMGLVGARGVGRS